MKIRSKFLVIALMFVLLTPFKLLADDNPIAYDNVTYDGGFVLRSDDENYKLQINGAIEPILRFRSEVVPDDTSVVGPSPTHRTKSISFGINYTGLWFSATVHKKVGFSLGLNYGTGWGGNSLRISGGTASYSINDWANVAVGINGIPFDMAGTGMSPLGRFLSEWPLPVVRTDVPTSPSITRPGFGAPGGLGVSVNGGNKKFYYGAAIINGNENNHEWNSDMKFAPGAKVGYNILGDSTPWTQSDYNYSETPNLTVNLGGYYQGARTDTHEIAGVDTDIARIKYIMSGTLGLAFRFKGLAVTVETYGRRTKIGEYYVTAGIQGLRYTYDDFGYYGIIGYSVIPKKLEIGIEASQIFRQGPDNNSNQIGGGLNWFIWGKNLKLGADYIWTEAYGDVWGSDSNNIHRATIRLTSAF